MDRKINNATINIASLAGQSKEEIERIGKALASGAIEAIGRLMVLGLIFILGISLLFQWMGWESWDSTDAKQAGIHSGMRLRTDYGTGCQYLQTRDGFLTPRLRADGSMVCGNKAQ